MIFRKKLVTFWQISTLVTLPVTASMMSSVLPALISLCHPLAPLLLGTYSFVPNKWIWAAFLLLYVHCFSLCFIISHCIFIPHLPFPIKLAFSVFQRLAILALWICSIKGIGLISTWFPLSIFSGNHPFTWVIIKYPKWKGHYCTIDASQILTREENFKLVNEVSPSIALTKTVSSNAIGWLSVRWSLTLSLFFVILHKCYQYCKYLTILFWLLSIYSKRSSFFNIFIHININSEICNPFSMFSEGCYILRKTYQPIPLFLPREFHGWRVLADPSPGGGKESDTTEPLTLSLMYNIYFNSEFLCA